MALSDLLQPPNPDGVGAGASESTPRALSLGFDPSLGGATRTGSDAGSVLDNLLQSIGAQFRTAAASAILSTPAGQQAVADYKAQQVQLLWNQYGPIAMLVLIGLVLFFFLRR
jgi:type VI protein secretion system component VasF